MRLTLGAAVAILSMVVFVGSAPARTVLPDQKVSLAGIKRAVAKGWVTPTDAARYRNTVNRAAALIGRLPRSRSAPLAANLHQVAQVATKLTDARARAVLGQLAVNNTYFVRHGPPVRRIDITDADGVVYRYMSGLGFEFHPLANFGALNAKVANGSVESVQRLAEALAARAVNEPDGGLGWEYYFNYAGGRAPWLSGMAQAVAAQALTGAANVVEADAATFTGTARGAYRTIASQLLIRRSAGPWIKLYGFNRTVVLNAQLQSLLSLRDYANATVDGDAATLSTAMERAVATDLHRFDTGYWTYYSLPRNPSSLDYQGYVVRLLRKLNSGDARLASAANRFAGYAKQPPAFEIATGKLGAVRFWLSKPASVEMRSSAGSRKRLTLYGGWYNLGWKLPRRVGAYSVLVQARDWAGNSASFSDLPIVRVVPAATWKVVGSSASQTKSLADAAEAGVASRTAATNTTSSLGLASFSVGAGLDNAAQAPLLAGAGLNSARLSIPWRAGASAPDTATLDQLRSLPTGLNLIVELSADPLPADATERANLAAFASSLVGQIPSIGELLLGPAPALGSAPIYVAALAAIRDVVKPSAAAVAVAGELDGAKSPGATLTALAAAYRSSGRTEPLMDELAFRPAPAPGKNVWAIGNYAQLTAALGRAFPGGAQKGATLPMLIDGVASATTIPPEKAGAYPSPPGPVPGVGERAQRDAYKLALQTTFCQPNISGVIFGRLIDRAATAAQSGDQSGLYYADGSAKTSLGAVAKSAALAGRGALDVCPGLRVSVTAKTLVFPLGFSNQAPPQVALACSRDCAYLVTLERADRKPVRAKRGVLNAGVIATLKIAGPPLPAGSGYHLRVRLVASTSPGPIQQYLSPSLSAG